MTRRSSSSRGGSCGSCGCSLGCVAASALLLAMALVAAAVVVLESKRGLGGGGGGGGDGAVVVVGGADQATLAQQLQQQQQQTEEDGAARRGKDAEVARACAAWSKRVGERAGRDADRAAEAVAAALRVGPRSTSREEARERFDVADAAAARATADEAARIPPRETETSSKLALALKHCRWGTEFLLEQTIDFASFPTPPPVAGAGAEAENKRLPPSAFTCLSSWTAINTSQPLRFRVSLCVHTFEQLTGAFRLERLRGCASRSESKSGDDPEYWRVVEDTYGSEEFAMVLRGPEMLGLKPKHLGNCVFDLPFRVSVAGTYSASLVWYRGNYLAARHDITNDGTFETQLLVRNHTFRLGIIASPASDDEARVLAAGGAGLVPCTPNGGSRFALARGRWVRARSAPEQQYQWTPWECRLPSLADAWRACVLRDDNAARTGFSLHIAGDENAARMVAAVVNDLCGRGSVPETLWPLNEDRSFDVSGCVRVGNRPSFVHFNSDDRGGRVSVLLHETTSPGRRLMFGFGHRLLRRPSLRWGATVNERLVRVMRVLGDASAHTRSRVVAFDAPVVGLVGHSHAHAPRGEQDGRTLPRVVAWNRRFTAAMADVGVWVAPLFDIGFAHYGSFVVGDDDASSPPLASSASSTQLAFVEAARVGLTAMCGVPVVS